MLDRLHLTPGLYDLPADVYHADPCERPSLSSTIAKKMLAESPLHAWTASPRLNPNYEPTDSKTFDIGRAAHRAVLGKGGDYVAYPASMLASNGAASTKEAKAWADEQRAEGRTPLKADDVDRVGAMADVLRAACADMRIVLDPEHSERTAIAEIDGVMCRAMIDNAHPDPRRPLIDFKTIQSATPEACKRGVENYGYDVQWAHYAETWRAVTGEDRDFIFIFQEKEPPFEIGVVRLLRSPGHSEDWFEDAADKIAAARRTWGDCLSTGIWPGYPRLIMEIGASPYHRQRWQDQSARAEISKSISKETIARASAWQSPEKIT